MAARDFMVRDDQEEKASLADVTAEETSDAFERATEAIGSLVRGDNTGR